MTEPPLCNSQGLLSDLDDLVERIHVQEAFRIEEEERGFVRVAQGAEESTCWSRRDRSDLAENMIPEDQSSRCCVLPLSALCHIVY